MDDRTCSLTFNLRTFPIKTRVGWEATLRLGNMVRGGLVIETISFTSMLPGSVGQTEISTVYSKTH